MITNYELAKTGVKMPCRLWYVKTKQHVDSLLSESPSRKHTIPTDPNFNLIDTHLPELLFNFPNCCSHDHSTVPTITSIIRLHYTRSLDGLIKYFVALFSEKSRYVALFIYETCNVHCHKNNRSYFMNDFPLTCCIILYK